MRSGVYARQSSGKAKSIADQIADSVADVQAQGWEYVTYQDGTSASRYAKKARDEWPRVLGDISSGALDVLVLWESSRGDRDLPTWAGMLALCRQKGVLIRVTTHGRTYDMTNPRDWRTLAEDGIDSAYETEKLSLRIRRGVASAASLGRPAAGPCPYGFRRVYDPRTGELIGQEANPATATVVREITSRVAKSEPLSQIRTDLDRRNIAPPSGNRWYRQRIREVVLNPANIGKRRHKGDLHDAGWEPIVDEAAYWAAHRVLNDPTRLAGARPGRQVHLLTYLGECYNGHPLTARGTYYVCRVGCVSCRRDKLDRLVSDTVIARLSQPDAYELIQQDVSDAEVSDAEAEISRLGGVLDGWRLSAARGQTSPESLAVIEADLTAQIREARRKAEQARVPPALRLLLSPGADVRTRWAESTLPGRRDAIRALLRIELRACGQNSYTPLHQRLGLTWVGSGCRGPSSP